MNKKALKKETSAIFLAIVLVLGTIALTVPSFSVEAQATSDREKDYEHEDRDYKSRDHDKKDYYNDDDEDKKSYEKDSSSVFVKKVKCNNINVNLNGIDVNIGGLPINGPVNEPLAVAQESDDEDEDDEIESNSIENDEDKSYEHKDGKSDSNTNSKIVCINNNNNIVVAEEDEPETCEECFELFLTPRQIELFIDAVQGATSLEDVCIFLSNIEVDIDEFEEFLDLINVDDPEGFIDCLENVGIEFGDFEPI